MTPREKKLAAITGLMAVVLGGFFIWNQVSTALENRHSAIASLDQEIADKQSTIKRAGQATKRLNQYEQRSLPASQEVARSVYQDWLLDLAEQAELEKAKVTVSRAPNSNGVIHRLPFNVSGIGRLDQIALLLQKLYANDHLHLIRGLRITPITDSRKLNVTIGIEAAVLPGSTNENQLTNLANPWLASTNSKKLVDKIIDRNLFAPPNHPPKLASIGSKRAYVRRKLSFTAKATDSDPLDTVTYELSKTAPDGSQIGGSSGQFSWTPKELGTFEFDILSKDDGIPSKTARQTVRVTVVEPPKVVVTKPPPTRPRKPGFDIAKHTYLIGTTERRGRPEIWLQVRTTGKIHKLSTGDAVSFGSIAGQVAKIGNRDAEITIGDQQRILVRIGENLLEADKQPAGGS